MTERTETILQDPDEVVAFRVGGNDYCIDITSVREIRGWTETTKLPRAQTYVKGVINLRGAVVPVIDLSSRLGLGETEPDQRHVIIIAVIASETVGLLADVVSDILTVDPNDLRPVPSIVSEDVRSFLSGILITGDTMIRKLDLRKLLPRYEAAAA